MTDHSAMKLGKLPARPQAKKLTLADYATAALPTPPASLVQSSKVKVAWGMMLNDTLGDCTIAAAGHAIMLWTASNNDEYTPPDAKILTAYEAVGGYKPGHPNTDNGAVIEDVLVYWKKTGIGGHKIAASAPVHQADHSNVMLGVWLFGAVDIGLDLPLSAQTQTVWDVPAGGAKGKGKAGSWGGHSVIVVDYNATGPVVVTWGALKQMTWAFWNAYCDEAWIALSQDWLAKGACPAGFDLAALQADMADLD